MTKKNMMIGDRQTDRNEYTHTRTLTMKKNDTLSFAAIFMILLKKISQV